MTPREFHLRMEEVVRRTHGDPQLRDAMAFELMREALLTNGFGRGLEALANASPERIPAASVAQSVRP